MCLQPWSLCGHVPLTFSVVWLCLFDSFHLAVLLTLFVAIEAIVDCFSLSLSDSRNIAQNISAGSWEEQSGKDLQVFEILHQTLYVLVSMLKS